MMTPAGESPNEREPFGGHTQLIPSRFRLEVSDKLAYCMQDKLGDIQVRCVISLNHRIDAKRMAKAVRLTLDAEPILGCRLIEHWWCPYWERRNDLDQIKTCRLIEVTDHMQEIIRYMSTPINPTTDPLVQVQIIRSATDVLCIKLDHMIADACGIKEYAYLLASVYRKLADEPGYVPEPNLGASRSHSRVSKCFGLLDKLKIVRSGFRTFKRRFHPPAFWSFPSIEGELSNRMFMIRQLGPERFRAIKEYGHKCHATLNDIMLAAIYRAVFEFINPDPSVPLRLTCTVDFRRYLPSGRTGGICSLSNFVYTNIGYELGNTFDDTTLKVRDDMNAMKADYIGLWDFFLAILVCKGIPFSWTRRLIDHYLNDLTSTGNFPPGFSNGGIIDPEQLVFGDASVTDAYLLGATYYPPLFGMGFSSFGESLTLSISFFESAIKEPVVKRLLDRIEYDLPA